MTYDNIKSHRKLELQALSKKYIFGKNMVEVGQIDHPSVFLGLKVLFVLKIFKCPNIFRYVEKQFDKKANVNLNFNDVTTCLINNNNTHIAQHLEKSRQ